MSNSPINLTRISTRSLQGGSAPTPGAGEEAKKEAAKYKPVTEHTAVKRTIPVTDFKPIDADDPEADANGAAPAGEAAAEETRHAKWQAAQEAKRAARAASRVEADAKRQGLANELLKKGDLAGASKALGIPASELVTLVNQAAMGMRPEETPPKTLTPEEQRTADETAFRAEMKAFRKEQEDYRGAQNMKGFIENSIRPVLADKDAYEMIHAAGATDIETYAYRYINAHYYETSEKDEAGKITKPGEVWNAKDVLDEIEENLVKQQVATLERAKALKKVAKYFAPEAPAEDALPAAKSEQAGSTSLTSARRARIAQAMADEEAESEPEAQVEPPKGDPAAPKVVRSPAPGANVRATHLVGGRLTAAERIARARAEEEAAARASLVKRR